jgi:LmbE family N-acetylglucosaminyl deacetylase
VVLTDGALYGDVATRRKESHAAAAMLGYGEPEFWGLPDRGLVHDEALVERLAQKIRAAASDLVYAPSLREIHPDHRQLAMAAIEALRRVGGELRLAQYEVAVPLSPNLLLDISARLQLKEQAMQCFASQLARQPYDQHIAALNRFRTYTLPRETTAAEAYRMLSAAELEHGGDTASEFCEQDFMTKREIAAMQQQLDAVMNSRSWKITAPLRWLARLLRRA